MRSNFKNIFAKLAAAESSFMQSEFLSPVIRGQPVSVRIANVIMKMEIERPKNFEGWGVFRPTTERAAALVRQANMAERRTYLSLFPKIRLVACVRDGAKWSGIPALKSDKRFSVTGMVPIRLPGEVQMFDVVDAAFDGNHCWYVGPYRNAGLRTAATLRTALSNLTDADKVECSEEEREAYLIALMSELENRKDREEERIKATLVRAGAMYRSYVKRGDAYTVEFTVDGKTHKSTVNSRDLSVLSAGICLSGGDAAFDLQSLVTVIREGDNRGRIVRVGDNVHTDYDDDD